MDDKCHNEIQRAHSGAMAFHAYASLMYQSRGIGHDVDRVGFLHKLSPFSTQHLLLLVPF